MTQGKPTTATKLSKSERIERLRLASALIAGSTPDENTFAMLNRLLESERIEVVCYENGITVPTSALSLRMEAARQNADHSGILQRKIQNATGKKKPFGAATHHIVAWDDHRAERSRTLLFGWAISINDADNGVFLRQGIDDKIWGLNKMPPHAPMHSTAYHLAVFNLLSAAANDTAPTAETAAGGRAALKGIKAKIQANRFKPV